MWRVWSNCFLFVRFLSFSPSFPSSLLVGLALLHGEFFHTFSLLWELALRQALLQCVCTKQGTSTSEQITALFQELPSYQASFFRMRFVFCCVLSFLALNSLCLRKPRKSKGDVHIQGQGSVHPFLKAVHSPYYSVSQVRDSKAVNFLRLTKIIRHLVWKTVSPFLSAFPNNK